MPIRYEFYDPILDKPVSNQDRVSGSHSSGEAASHKLLDIGKAYKDAVYSSHEADTRLAAQRADLDRKVLKLQGRAVGLGENASEVEEELYATVQHALFELQDVTQTKMALLVNEQMELRRQLEEIDWLEQEVNAHAKAHENMHDPAGLVAGWSSLSALDHELSSKRQASRDVQSAELASARMQPELVVQGRLSVVIEDETATTTPLKPSVGSEPPKVRAGPSPGGPPNAQRHPSTGLPPPRPAAPLQGSLLDSYTDESTNQPSE